MYTLSVLRTFIARHFLIGGDWGPENLPNSHRYRLELRLEGTELDAHGFLCDIVEVERRLDQVLDRYADAMLNELSEFEGLNPSLENFARILALALHDLTEAGNITGLTTVLWEDESAWASYTLPA
jgi:6-pyruvoyltetrahydropterin/6-carboxytetrahydropterin synthase